MILIEPVGGKPRQIDFAVLFSNWDELLTMFWVKWKCRLCSTVWWNHRLNSCNEAELLSRSDHPWSGYVVGCLPWAANTVIWDLLFGTAMCWTPRQSKVSGIATQPLRVGRAEAMLHRYMEGLLPFLGNLKQIIKDWYFSHLATELGQGQVLPPWLITTLPLFSRLGNGWGAH